MMDEPVTRKEFQEVTDRLNQAIEGAVIISQVAKRFAMVMALQSAALDSTISLLEQGLEHDSTTFLFSGWTDKQIQKYREAYSEHLELLRQLRNKLR